MSRGRHSIWQSLGVVFVTVGLIVAFVIWAILVGPEIQRIIVRVVVVSLVIFLVILFLRYFSLLWFSYLGHAERNVLGVREIRELPPVSIIIPAYNEGRVLERALTSLMRLEYPEYEVLVVDDGSRDDTLEIATQWEGQRGAALFRVITKPNGGKASALNAGIAHSMHPLVFCMDADSYLEPRSLLHAARHFTDPAVGAVAGNVKVENRKSIVTRLQALEYIEGLNMPRRAQGFIAAVNIVPGPVGLFRREALEEIGGYDTDTYAEDADLTLKMMAAGWRVQYEDQAIAWSEAPESWRDLTQQRYRWTRGILQAIRKRKGLFLRPFPDFPLWISTIQLGFEALVWPVMNVFAHLFFAIVAILFGAGELIVYWMILLTLLDLVAALVTVSMEEESLSLVPMALIYRFVFILFLDVVKMFATMEELFRLDMGWGKLERSEAPA
ncbi:MAG: glycosyltransferase family 2 protein [Gemmatimonadetes bacterium]|nr:glycosyltransferase family 2 protein [Gemmatimonadota bacterium]NNL30844.1 glycosyltransferase family 2 protein [Gemmatimonadota bacterium]